MRSVAVNVWPTCHEGIRDFCANSGPEEAPRASPAARGYSSHHAEASALGLRPPPRAPHAQAAADQGAVQSVPWEVAEQRVLDFLCRLVPVHDAQAVARMLRDAAPEAYED